MMPLLGRTLILLSLLVATTGAMAGFAAGARRSPAGLLWTKRFAYLYAALVLAANFVMVYALLAHDFSVSYVAQVGSRALPTWVTIVSLWSSLEGSILFWVGVLGIYIAVATWANRNDHPELMPYAIGTWLACAAFFSFLVAGPAQPFHTVVNPPMDGPGPNPLLQNHILMAIHPPFLYLGYVGMTIPFGLASAALLVGSMGASFLKPLRTWTLVSWTFLTVAIVLGGWWAYEVLGWGGYWAWDPVENASFLPWLTATAALHSLIVVERKAMLKGWTATLILASFLLVILGTFMTRSGVFNSVHSFTQSAIGPTIMAFLSVALLWSVFLLATRIDKLTSEGSIQSPRSREGAFIVNNLLFVLFTLTVLIGTVFPLVVEATRGVQMSVGRPYFDKMAIPIGIALLMLLGIGPALPWGRATKEQMKRALLPPIAGGIVLMAIGALLGARNVWTLLTLLCGGFAAQVTLREMWLPARQRVKGGEALLEAVRGSQFGRGRRRFASYVIHAGAVVIIISIAVSSTMQESTQAQLRAGQSTQIGKYTLTFLGVREVPEPHRVSTIADMEVRKNGRFIGVLQPRMNQYERQREPIGTPAVKTMLTEDLYLSIMNVNPAAQSVGFQALINPMVGWIWIATGLMGLGGVMALIPMRIRERREAAAALARDRLSEA
jgi:cytochrome c-type biogenesis protein CcmF